MTPGIFATEAPRHWEAGLPVIPLMEGQKRPAVHRWQLFADTFPTEDERRAWISTFNNSNIGLPMGPVAGLVAIDIDTDDEAVRAVIESVVPASPWKRVGAKGYMLIYRYNGDRNTYIRDADGKMLCEVKSKGSQIVLPPSIHPDTGLPYTASSDLVSVCRAAPELPEQVELRLREAFTAAGFKLSAGGTNNKIAQFVPAGARDNAMVWHAGLLARVVLKGERSLLQALGEMETWVESFVEKIVGDRVTVGKARAKVIEFLIRDVTGEKRIGLPIGWDEGLSPELKEQLGLNFTEDDEKWTAEKITTYLHTEFERFNEDKRSKGRINAINVALDKIVRAGGELSALDEAMILRFITVQSAGTMLQSDLKRQLQLLRKGDIAGENHKELAEAAIEYLSRFGEVRFDAGMFWQWKGAFWERKEEHEILKVIAEEYGAYPAARRQSDHSGIMRVMRSIAAIPLNRAGRGLNFANGFLNDKLVLEKHQPDHGMTYVLPYRYLPDLAGHMPMFDQYLLDSWGLDPDYHDKRDALQESMGATLFSHATSFQRAFCLFGQPGSGKSRMSSIMRGLLPQNSIAALPPHDWRDKFMPANLFGKVLNFAGELSESKNIPGDIFKQVIEGEEIMAQHKNGHPFQFKPLCAHWFNSNHLPKTKDYSDGFNRRWLFLEWNHRVPDDKKIPDLDKIILHHEREAIIAWAVLGYERLVRHGQFTLPASHLALADQMAMDNNSVRYFLQACPRIVVGREKVPNAEHSATDLHGEYWQFCLTTSTAQRVSLPSFMKMMKELQPVFNFRERLRQTKSGHPETIYEGIALAPAVRVGT